MRKHFVNNTCVINVKLVKYFKTYCNVYMHYSRPRCKTFRIKVRLMVYETIVTVYSYCLSYHHKTVVERLMKKDFKGTLKRTEALAFKS